jgi:bacterioferritin-associated ferredoxin
MYLCICNAVSEDRVVEAIESGCSSFNEISKATGLSAECGQCACKARKECERLLRQYSEHSQNPSQFSAA